MVTDSLEIVLVTNTVRSCVNMPLNLPIGQMRPFKKPQLIQCLCIITS